MLRECSVAVARESFRYLESGAGWPVLLLHAFPFTADMWRPQLERVPDGWRYIAPDLRGFGGGPAPQSAGMSLDLFARDVVAFLDALEIESSVIAGLSMGGYIAFAALRISPERFSAVVLANTRAQADTDAGRDARRKLSALVRSAGPAAVADDMLPKLLSESARQQNQALVADVRRMITSNGAGGIDAAILAMMNRPDSTAMLPRIGVPALVIAGENDAVIPISDAELLDRQIPRSRLVVLPRAGHLSNLESPEEFSLALGDFLTAPM